MAKKIKKVLKELDITDIVLSIPRWDKKIGASGYIEIEEVICISVKIMLVNNPLEKYKVYFGGVSTIKVNKWLNNFWFTDIGNKLEQKYSREVLRHYIKMIGE